MIINKIETGIGLSYKEDGKRIIKTIPYSEYPSYFYIHEHQIKPIKIKIKDKWGRFDLELSYETDDSYKDLEGDSLVKVSWKPNHSRYAYNVRRYFEKQGNEDLVNPTYEADVKHEYRYAIDNIDSIKEYNLTKLYFDMEWMQGGEFDEQITCITCRIDGEDFCYTWLPNEGSEADVINDFLDKIVSSDADMIISWFGWKFDIPKLIERAVANGIDIRRISPYSQITGVSNVKGTIKCNTEIIHRYSPVSQPIKGRIVVPLDLAFERQWNDSQRGTLPSMALDYVSETILGNKKLVSTKFPDKNEFFARGWIEDNETYIEYAIKDTQLISDLDNKMNITDSILSLQKLLVAPFDACFYASNMGTIYFSRTAHWKAPTGRKTGRKDYDGAMVYDPLSEATNGLHWGVAAFDFAGLYPSMMVARNISWETKSTEPTSFAVNLSTPKDFSEISNEDMLYYNTDKLGMLPKSVLNLKTLRDSYKQKMKVSSNKEEYNKWNSNQMAVKRLMASFYGVLAYQGFGWADVDLAASITASAREAIRSAAFKAREL